MKRALWVVDDSDLDAERARRLLANECTVTVLKDGSAALERLTVASPPAVMVLDWVMPGVTGVEVCRFLRSVEGGLPAVGILLLTAHRNTDQIVEGLSAGANDYLAKPYEDEELVARVRSLLRTRELLERAEQAEALSRTLLETAPDPLLAFDIDGRLTFANQAACECLNVELKKLLGSTTSEILPKLMPALVAPFSETTPPTPFADMEIGGRIFSPSVRALPYGKSPGAIVALRDVTERHRANARRLDFYSVIAHDLRSPLNTITLRTDLILAGLRGAVPDRVLTDVRKIDKSLKSLIAMINDFLDLAQLDNADYRLDPIEVDMLALIDHTIEDFQPLFEANQLTWRRSPAHGAQATVIGDARRLQQVMTNLIGNAIKFTPARGTITTRVEVGAEGVTVSVEDTGRGIAADALATIFERYVRVQSTQPEVPGTGLGLMIVREIIEAHGGHVGVESTQEIGSKFWFRLPPSPQSPPASIAAC